MSKKGALLIVLGPSGSGKGTVMSQLLKEDGNTFYSISVTTRTPRPGEIDGKHYYFKTKEQAKQMIENNEMLEYACYCDNIYGTPKAPAFERLERGENVVLEIEMQGAQQVKKIYPQAITVFIKPPSMEVLRQRLTGRGTESAEVVEKRMETAVKEMSYSENCDYIVVNDEVENAVAEIRKIIDSNTK